VQYGTDFQKIADHLWPRGFCAVQDKYDQIVADGSIPGLAVMAKRADDLETRRIKLPYISIESFVAVEKGLSYDSSWCEKEADSLAAACRDYGFFYLSHHGIPEEKLDKVISLAREFFALPLVEKDRIKRYDAGGPEGGDGARGYQGLGENVTGGLKDMQEAIDFYRDWDEDKREEGDGGPGSVKTLQGRNLWPELPPELKDVYLDYIEEVKLVGRALMRAMGAALKLGTPMAEGADRSTEDEDTFVRNTDDPFWVMRMIGYPPLEDPLDINDTAADITQYSCGEHTDYGCVTLLLSDSTPGALQVQLKDGTWINANPIPGYFVVNIGDMMERWTNGLWKSTKHRVIHRGDKTRISVPFFFEPNFDAVVKPLAKCVEETGGMPIHEGSTYGEHLLTKVFSNFYYSKRTDW
jgi:isopenicillin N synthase-like dioxygenase